MGGWVDVGGFDDLFTRLCIYTHDMHRLQQQQQEAEGTVVGEAEGEGADALVERLGGAMDYTPGAAASVSSLS